MTTHTITSPQDLTLLKDFVTDRGFKTARLAIDGSGATLSFEPHESFRINTPGFSFPERAAIMAWLKTFKTPAEAPSAPQDALIYGKDPTPNIVSIEAKDGALELFIEEAGKVRSEIRENKFWLLAPRKYDQGFEPLTGNLHYRYIKYYSTKEALYADKNKYRVADTYSIANEKEAAMLLHGLTYYKNMKVDDVSRFHFDLETAGLLQASHHKIFLISTTFVSRGVTIKKLFSLDEYDSEVALLTDFCDYLRDCNPSIVTGFNIFGFDFPYLQICADNNDVPLTLGRDGSALRFDRRESKFRKDGSQDYDYKRCHIYGREIVDMMFVAYHFDFARKYERYALKSIIKQEGLEKEGRQFYDASQIARNWEDPVERAKIKAYCIDDADDSESLYKLMISAYFYWTQHIPKSFQAINYTATGSQVNSFLVRGYLQDGHSIPKADDPMNFPGALSDGFPGIYRNCYKLDIQSLYPSVMMQYEICDVKKDPNRYFLKMVTYFTEQRLADKKKAKETGDRYYEELEQSRKIAINSAYGLLGAPGLNFNSPKNAALVTEHGREILKKAIYWATGQHYQEKIKEE